VRSRVGALVTHKDRSNSGYNVRDIRSLAALGIYCSWAKQEFAVQLPQISKEWKGENLDRKRENFFHHPHFLLLLRSTYVHTWGIEQ
jgi:hypothetical protein